MTPQLPSDRSQPVRPAPAAPPPALRAFSRRQFLRDSVVAGAGLAASAWALRAFESGAAARAAARPGARAAGGPSRRRARHAPARLEHGSTLPSVTSFLDREQADELLKIAVGGGADFAEVYGEYTITSAFLRDEGQLKSAQYGILSGVGIRVIDGQVVGYAYADEYGMEALREAARVAAAVAARGTPGIPGPFGVSQARPPFRLTRPAPLFADDAQKIALCERADGEARGRDPRIAQCQVVLADSAKSILVANSQGLWVEDRQFVTRLAVRPTAIEGTNRQSGFATGGGSVEADYFEKIHTPEAIAGEAAASAIALLTAVDARAGSYPVIVDHGWGGVLVHECFGHSLEGDGIRKKTSIREHQLGQKVCAEIVDIYDDGTVPFSRGSFKVDDEGTPSRKNHVVEKGMLRGYLWDRLNGKLTGHESTGNGRRNSYRDYPIPRMTNTYIAAGESDPGSLFAAVKYGLFCKSMGGGSVNPADGNFSFVVSEGTLIEHGRLTRAVKGATLTGNAADAMLRIDGLGNDLAIDVKTGSCGKDGQWKPVGVGQPTVRFSELTVGGTDA